ncbi:MAG: glucose 1-dehydrogenase [Anaerolineae bacterium]|nr:glucose 1-dehydrogenase [Anaerolineae bacterium]
MDSLKDKVAIVTGAGQGIGFAIGERFAREGAHVVVAEIQADKAQATTQYFSSLGTEALAIPMDVGEPAQIDMMVKTVVQKFGRIDILVNNAGVSEKADFFEMTPERWDWMQRINQRGVFFCLQTVARQMVAQIPEAVKTAGFADHSYGKIINMSSIAGRHGRADALHYSVSKAAVITITQGAAMALAPYNINVNAICPSVIRTPMWEEIDRIQSETLQIPQGEWYKRRVKRIPLQRGGTVEQIAATVMFLCSEAGDYITGQTYNVDGGSEMN